jgi:hypothetical protein
VRLRRYGIAAPLLALLDPQLFHEVRIVRPQFLDCGSAPGRQHLSSAYPDKACLVLPTHSTSAATRHLEGFAAAS